MDQIKDCIKLKIHRHFINIIFNRPSKKNALNTRMIDEIKNTLRDFKDNKQIKIILFSSESDIFCAGADLESLQRIKDFSYDENLKDSINLMELFKTMLTYPKLIISKVEGAAIAGGCGITTASDIVFATEEAKFGYPEVKIGFIPALVSTFLTKKINEQHARELLLTGKLINAKSALDIGLINYICQKNKIDIHIKGFVEKHIKTTSSNSIYETKQMLYHWLDLDKKLNQAAEFNALNRKSEDFKKGISCFLSKREIDWIKDE
ncbi:enoyl-CoA hydratase/isomerase family protein [Flavobacteriales bacterium]|nr:enoyl-CoA hydratase/isomerase family protein [Flavobacteriales bacterium]